MKKQKRQKNKKLVILVNPPTEETTAHHSADSALAMSQAVDAVDADIKKTSSSGGSGQPTTYEFILQEQTKGGYDRYGNNTYSNNSSSVASKDGGKEEHS